MTIQIDGGQLVVAVAIAVVGPTAAAIFSEFRRSRSQAVIEATRAEQHRQNHDRLDKIESALGIENPDEVAFMRASDGRRIESSVREILVQLGNGSPGRFALRGHVEGLDRSAAADRLVLHEHTGKLIDHDNRLHTLRRDVDGLLADG